MLFDNPARWFIPALKLIELICRERHLLSDKEKREQAKDLYNACREWAAALDEMLVNSVSRWKDLGVKGVRGEVESLQRDELKVDYALLENSPLLTQLSDDQRFGEFSEQCSEFCDFALNLKRQVQQFRGDGKGLEQQVDGWRNGINARIQNLGKEYNKLRLIHVQE
jgi:hypothetical protein